MNSRAGIDPSAIEGAEDVLVVAPSVGGVAEDACGEVLTAGRPPERVLGVTIGCSPNDAVRNWRRHLPDTVDYAVVTVDGAARSVAAGSASVDPTVAVETVPDVEPLSRLGTTIADQLEDDRRTAVCLDSITDLIQYADRETVFRFLHALASKVRAADATGHYHLDAAHDPETVAVFTTLFDAVVEYDGGSTVPR